MYRKNIAYIHICGLEISTVLHTHGGVLECIPMNKGEILHIQVHIFLNY